MFCLRKTERFTADAAKDKFLPSQVILLTYNKRNYTFFSGDNFLECKVHIIVFSRVRYLKYINFEDMYYIIY